MRFAVRLLRYRGRVIPWREVVNRTPAIGDMRIEETRDDELRRYVRTAKLFPLDGLPRMAVELPQLHDVRVIGMSQQAFTLAGVVQYELLPWAPVPGLGREDLDRL